MSQSQLSSQNQNANNSGSQSVLKQAVYKKIGPYSLIKEIGQGSFARVYKGRTETNGVQEEFAIKMISKGHLREDNLELIDKEISILLQLKHKNIIKLIDFKKTSNNWYLVFEYCELGDLEQYMKEKFNGKFPLNIALMFIQQLSSAFQEIRRLKFVHRDLKLANILLTKDLTVKLGDFGFAKHFDDDSLLVSYCGTPITMAPEILKRDKYNEKCDIWSLGIIIYQMIYGKPPFNPPKRAHIQDLINLIERNQISWSGSFITPEVKDLINKMLISDPNKRITFEEFFEHPCMQPSYLQALVEGNPNEPQGLQEISDSVVSKEQVVNNNSGNKNEGNQDNNKGDKQMLELQTEVEKLQLSPKQQKSSASTMQQQAEEVMEVKEKQNIALEYIQKRLHEILMEDLTKYLERMQEYRKNAEQLSQDNSTDFSYSCAWSSVLLALWQTVKTIENHLEIVLIVTDQNDDKSPSEKKLNESFRIPFPKSIQERLIELSKELNQQIKSIKMDNPEQQKNTDVYNMLFGNLLHYADYSLLNELLNQPHVQLKYYNRCMKLCELLLSVKENAFSKIIIYINDPTMEITRQDIQKIIQIPLKDNLDNNNNNNNNNQNDANNNANRNLKRMSLIKKLINIEKMNTSSNYLEAMNIQEKTDELRTQYEIYQGRYEACLQGINQKN